VPCEVGFILHALWR